MYIYNHKKKISTRVYKLINIKIDKNLQTQKQISIK